MGVSPWPTGIANLAECRECRSVIVGAMQTMPYPLCYRCFENI